MTPPKLGRRWWIPLLTLTLPALLAGLRMALVAGEILPDTWFILQSLPGIMLMLGLGVIGVWFFFLAGFGQKTRIAGLGFLTVLVGSGVACIRRIEFDGDLKPILVFRWDKDHREAFEEHREKGNAPALAVLTIAPGDGTMFRGGRGDGTWPDLSLAQDWTKTPPRVAWVHPLLDGLAGIAAAGDSFVTIEQRGANETVVCYALDTGLQRWETGYPAEFRHTPNMGGGGPRTTPAIADGQVYTLGGAGDLSCLDGSTGKLLWRVNVLADNQAKNIEWGCSTSPLITGEQVIIQAGTAGVVAYDRIQGQRIWRGPPRESAYASPMLTEFAGSPHLVIFDAVGLLGLDPKTGQELWSYDWKSAMNMNSAQPVRVGQDGLFVSSEQANGGALLRITKNDNQWAVQQVWRNRSLVARFASPVLVGDCLYGLSAGRLVCLEASTGTQRWKEGNYGNGQILVSGSSLLITTESGELALVAADPEEHRELGRIKVLNSRTWNMPTLIGRSLLMRSHKEMARVELP